MASTPNSLQSESKDNLTIQDYLNASGEASSRTRAITLALVVACVLTFIALLNSLQNSWMLKRLERLRHGDSEYLARHIGTVPKIEDYRKKWLGSYQRDQIQYESTHPESAANASDAPNRTWYEQQGKEEYEREAKMYEARYQTFLMNTSRALVDTRFLVRVPFFGITFDINDLGSLSGIGLITLLGFFRLSISNELENLKLSFRHVRKLGKLAEFYRLLSMKQVLTTPHLPDRRVGWFHMYVPKLIYFLPLGVYFSVVMHDIDTNNLGFQIDNARTLFVLASDVVFLVIVLALSIVAFQRTRDVDRQWSNAWCDYMAEEFRDTHDGEWLLRLHRAVEHKQFSPEQLVASLPEADEKPGKSYIYHSKSWDLIIDLDEGTSSLKPAKPEQGQTASA